MNKFFYCVMVMVLVVPEPTTFIVSGSLLFALFVHGWQKTVDGVRLLGGVTG